MTTHLMTQTSAHHNNVHHQHQHHHHNHHQNNMLECKSKYDAEFRRFGLNRFSIAKFDEFYALLERLHGLAGIAFNIYYTDRDGELLPINNDNNLARVLQVTLGVLRLIIFRRGECYPDHQQQQQQVNGSLGYSQPNVATTPSSLNYSTSNSVNMSGVTPSYRAANLISHIKELSTTLTSSSHQANAKPFVISYPADFRPVSAIIDVDILPESYRRVRLHKHKSSKPLGFYIRDGRSLRVTPNGVEQVPGIFISRLMPGGLAESTGLLSVNDEVIEVNGIEVAGKTLDQVTDMMVANSSNLIITVKPTNQKYNLNKSVLSQPGMSATAQLPAISKSMNVSAISAGSRKTSTSAEVSKMSSKSNDAVIVHHHHPTVPQTANSSGNANASSVTSSSSVNSSFSSSNQPINRHSFKATNGASQISTSTKPAAPIMKRSENKSETSTKQDHGSDDEEEAGHDDDEDEDEDDDDDDDEEIHDATNNHHHNHRSSPDNSNSDDKILTL